MGPSISWCLKSGFWLGYGFGFSGLSESEDDEYDDDDGGGGESLVEKNLSFVANDDRVTKGVVEFTG